MAATTFRRTSGIPSEDSLQSQRTDNSRVGTTSSSRRQHAYEGETGYAGQESETHVPRAHTVSYKNNPAINKKHNRSSNSFSARAKELPRDWMDKPLPPESPQSPSQFGHNTPTRRPPSSNPPASQDESMRDVASPETNISSQQTTPLSRSGTVRSSRDQRHDWASDRSPLQKLEVALGGISKEEKRARAQEAELRLKERLEGRKTGNDHCDASSPAPESIFTGCESARSRATDSQRPLSMASANTDETPPGRLPDVPEMRNERPSVPQGGPSSFRYAAVPLAGDLQYAKPSTGQGVTTGTVPRRAVSVSHHPERAGIPAPNRMSLQESQVPKRAISQVTPIQFPPHKAAQKQLNDNPGLGLSQHPSPHEQPAKPAQQRKPYVFASPQPTAGAGPAQNPVASGAVQPAGGNDGPKNVPSEPNNATKAPTKPKKQTVSFNVPPPTPPPVSDWKNAPVARLCLSDFEFQNLDVAKGKAWLGGRNTNRRRSRGLPSNYQMPNQKPKSYKAFQAPLHLRSGPLLRYTGMKRVPIDGPNGPFEKVTWRGSVLIVTKDSCSIYEPAPTLRTFSQPMDLLPPPPVEVNGDDEGSQLPPEYVDPTAGLMKLGRDGRPLYVKPVEHIEEEQDLSQIEDDDGIYEQSASILDYSSEGVKQPIPANRVHSTDGEVAGMYKELTGVRLYADPDRDVTFWRFNIEVELGQTQQRVAYRLNQGPAIGFWVPAKGQMMNIAFHSGNGFNTGLDTNEFCGPDPLWRDILNEHQTRPFHVMIGGGDQIFNDKVTTESPQFQEWLRIKNIEDQYNSPFVPEFRAELESSFLEHYSTWFSQGLFSLVGSQIPMVNMWNDHEILEGYGAYPDEFMQAPVISGLGRIAFKYYLLFQHHSVLEETDNDEPSFLLGAEPGPYIRERSRNLFMSLGKGVTLLGLDERTERMSHEVLSEPTCDLIWDRCHREISRGNTKHLVVLSSIPIAYPRMAMLKNILNSRKSLGKAGIFGGLVNKNGGKIEIFDDHWTAKQHKAERTYLIEDLQDLAAEKSVRVTVLSGDVQLAAMGQFYSNPKLGLAKDKDYRYMPNIISSGIANCPETEMVSDVLNRRNQVHHMDSNTDEDMIPIFTQDVDGKARNNKRLLPRRNWCSIREYQPGSTPPGTPEESEEEDEPRPGKLQRTLSLTRGERPAGSLLRRLSGRGPPPTKDFNLGGGADTRRMSMDGPFPPSGPFSSSGPGPLFRRPTLSRRGSTRSKKSIRSTGTTGTIGTTNDDGINSMVNLEGGLVVTLNLELNPKDPSGITTPYKLLVPMLRYDGAGFEPPAMQVAKGWRKWLGVQRNDTRTNNRKDGGNGSPDMPADMLGTGTGPAGDPKSGGGGEDTEAEEDYDEDEEEDDDVDSEEEGDRLHRQPDEDHTGQHPASEDKRKRRKWFGF